MAGLGRIDVIHLSAIELSQKLNEVGLSKSLTDALEAKEIKGSTLLMFSPEDIKYELEDLSIEDRMHLRNFLREIRKSDDLEITVSRTITSPRTSSGSSQGSSTDTMYLRSSDSEVSLVEKSSDESSDSRKSSSHDAKKKSVKLPKIGFYKPLDLPNSFELPRQFGSKVDKMLKQCTSPSSIPDDVQRAFIRQVTDHLDSENSSPSSKTVEWIAWKYCSLYPGLQQVNPLHSLVKSHDLPLSSGTFKEWGLLAEKIRRSLQNKRYQRKRKSLANDCLIVKIQKLDTEKAPGVAVDDDASLARHSKRLQEELGKSVLDFAVIGSLMTAEFAARRKFIKSLDVRTRVRETLNKYHILKAGDQLDEELLRILTLERKIECVKEVKDMLTNWRVQHGKLKGYFSQNFSVEEDDITDDVLLKHINKIFPTKHKKKDLPKELLFARSWDDEVKILTS